MIDIAGGLDRFASSKELIGTEVASTQSQIHPELKPLDPEKNKAEAAFADQQAVEKCRWLSPSPTSTPIIHHNHTTQTRRSLSSSIIPHGTRSHNRYIRHGLHTFRPRLRACQIIVTNASSRATLCRRQSRIPEQHFRSTRSQCHRHSNA